MLVYQRVSLFLGFYQLWSLWGGFHRSIGFYFDPFRPDHSSEYSCEDDGFQTPRVARRELKITGWFPMATPNYHPIIVGFSITIHVWDPKSRNPPCFEKCLNFWNFPFKLWFFWRGAVWYSRFFAANWRYWYYAWETASLVNQDDGYQYKYV